MNKASGGDGIPVELFQILKDDAVKVLHSICQQIWKTGQEATVRTGHGTTEWFKIRKGVCQDCILSLCFYAKYTCEMLGWMKHKLDSRLLGEISITTDI